MSASVKHSTDIYKNQPGRIEDYVPGHSSISEKEAKEVSAIVTVLNMHITHFVYQSWCTTPLTASNMYTLVHSMFNSRQCCCTVAWLARMSLF